MEPADGTVKGRRSAINLKGTYELNWKAHSQGSLDETNQNEKWQFRCLVVEINP